MNDPSIQTMQTVVSPKAYFHRIQFFKDIFFFLGLKVYYLAECNLKIIFILCSRSLASMHNQNTTKYHLLSELCNSDEPNT